MPSTVARAEGDARIGRDAGCLLGQYHTAKNASPNDADALEPAVTTSWYLTSVQAGYEPWSGSVGAGVDGFSATVT